MRLRLLVVLGTLAVGVVGPAPPAEAGGGGCHGPATEGTGTMVETRSACFTPTVLRVPVGTTVTFANRDGLEHSLSGVGMDFAELGPDQAADQRFDRPGVYAYQCYLHPGMTGAVVVGAEPVLAAASGGLGDSDGRSSAGWWPLVAILAIFGSGAAILFDRRRTRKGDAGQT